MKVILSPRKELITAVSKEPDPILKPLQMVSKKEEEDKSCQENQSDIDEYKTKTCTNKSQM